MKKSILVSLLLLISVSFLFSQDDESSRTMMKRTVYYVKTDGSVHKADYWSIPMGLFDITVVRDFPGEGEVKVDLGANLNFISSGYIEGVGAGERGKIYVKAEFGVMDGDSLVRVSLSDVDYIYMGGKKIKPIKGAEKDLYIMIEDPKNFVRPKRLGINVYWFDPGWGELQHKEDVYPIIAISFTEEGAKRGWAAAKKAAGM